MDFSDMIQLHLTKKCLYCKNNIKWLNLFYVKSSDDKYVISNCYNCKNDFILDGVLTCGHSICKKCFGQLEIPKSIINLNDREMWLFD
jgi:hypothetical protein